jgi:hypothetical protein
MPAEFDNSGLKKFLKKFEDKPETQAIPPCTPEFMQRFTDYDSLEELVIASGFTPKQIQGFQNTINAEWEQFIKNHTRFDSWQGFIERWATEHLR